MVLVLILLVNGVPLTLSQNNEFVLVRDASASTSAQTIENETLWLDTYGGGYPSVYSSNPLMNGTTYLITIEGTWSPWSASDWIDEDDPPVGAFEEAPMYPSSGGAGRVGLDPFWGFACVFGSDYASENMGWTSLPAKSAFRISLDYGSSWSTSIRPSIDLYSPTHKYKVTVVGEGENIGFRIVDAQANDNYGTLKIVIEGDQDADGDGLLDSWEKDGIDSDSDGHIDLDLKASGADWQHKDIFVEVDYMNLCKPDPLAISDVQIAFGKAGINLHVLVDQEIDRQLYTTWSDFDVLKSRYFGTAEDQVSSNKVAILEARKQVSHYCLFAFKFAEYNETTHYYKLPGYSGIGERPGNDFMVTLGYTSEGNPVYFGRMEQASVFMHELGHNLGLNHGGKDDVNYKPNYLSIMNYMFQFNDLYPNRPLDFSRTELNTLNEAALNEMDGVGVDYVSAGSGGWLFTGHKDPIQNRSVLSLLRPIDWDGDNFYNTSVRANVNNCTDLAYNSLPDQMLNGYNDWENIILPFQSSSNLADGVHGQSPEEMTMEVMMLMKESAQNYHDVALVNATPSSTVIYQNGILDITVRSANLGANNETADLSVYAGTTLIAQRTVSLERSNITSTVLRCDISTVPKGDQVIAIRLAQVLGEEDAFDNNLTYGTIEFTGETAPEDMGLSWPLVLGVSVAIIVVVAIALFIVFKRRGKKSV